MKYLLNPYNMDVCHITVLSTQRQSLQWRHNKHDDVSNNQRLDCLLNRLLRSRSKKISKLRETGFCEGNSPFTGEFPTQRASNAENVSIWWRHHGVMQLKCNAFFLSFFNCPEESIYIRLVKFGTISFRTFKFCNGMWEKMAKYILNNIMKTSQFHHRCADFFWENIKIYQWPSARLQWKSSLWKSMIHPFIING